MDEEDIKICSTIMKKELIEEYNKVYEEIETKLEEMIQDMLGYYVAPQHLFYLLSSFL